jgi:hypothetical protein|tara:strand:- start:552 stop:752 length:201 start_codon:yes stop_codon:yes gene_type:complete
MKNDLTTFERNLLVGINRQSKPQTKYNYKNLMEWSTDKAYIEKRLVEGEKMYEVHCYFVAIKEVVD